MWKEKQTEGAEEGDAGGGRREKGRKNMKKSSYMWVRKRNSRGQAGEGQKEEMEEVEEAVEKKEKKNMKKMNKDE